MLSKGKAFARTDEGINAVEIAVHVFEWVKLQINRKYLLNK